MSTCSERPDNGHCVDHQYITVLIDNVKTTSEDVKLIKDSLLGTMTEEGWISKIRTLENDVATLKKLKSEVTRNTLAFIGSVITIVITAIIGKFF